MNYPDRKSLLDRMDTLKKNEHIQPEITASIWFWWGGTLDFETIKHKVQCYDLCEKLYFTNQHMQKWTSFAIPNANLPWLIEVEIKDLTANKKHSYLYDTNNDLVWNSTFELKEGICKEKDSYKSFAKDALNITSYEDAIAQSKELISGINIDK